VRVPSRRIRERLAANEKAFGILVQLPSADVVEIAGYTGYDFAWIDAEHGCLSLSEVRDLIRAADASGIDSIVRIPNHDVTYVQRVLDMGASGIIIPRISGVEEGRALAASGRYGPAGTRGACPSTRAVGHSSEDWTADYQRADQDVVMIGLIESHDGVENVEAIAQECGFDGLMFGPFDLGMSIGTGGRVRHPDIRLIQQRVIAATHQAGIEYVVANTGWEPDLDGSGARIVTVLSDRYTLVKSFRTALADIRHASSPTQVVSS
jgi:4-hydroxy-2-oxoheptanedioate aldolase